MLRACVLSFVSVEVGCLVTPRAVFRRGTRRVQSAPALEDLAPSWEALEVLLAASETGQRLSREVEERESGPPHVDATTRTFDGDESSIRVTFYRDAAAWCPYCQKVWLFLEEHRIPYRVEKVPLDAYGYKPTAFSRLVDGGKLPALVLDGTLHVESQGIMEVLAASWGVATPGDERWEALEDDLMRDWFSLAFYPVEGERLEAARAALDGTLRRFDDMLGATPGPWAFGGDAPTLWDVRLVPTIERLAASVLYWKGTEVPGASHSAVAAWLEAWDARPSYRATRGDAYSLVMAMPSQNGPGYAVEAARAASARVYGLDGAWELPLPGGDDEGARHEAAFALVRNHENVSRFAARGASDPGLPAFHAELADPNAVPNDRYVGPVDVCLRHVAHALIVGAGVATDACRRDLGGAADGDDLADGWGGYDDAEGRPYWWNEITGESTWDPPTRRLDNCLSYLRARVGVPRDMGPGAAMQLRAHLSWAIALMEPPHVRS